MQKATIVANYRRQDCLNLANDLADLLRNKGLELQLAPSGYAYTVNDLTGVDFSGVDMAFVMGGDGTLLATGRHMAAYDVPLFGVNMGRVGFLAEVEPDALFAAVDDLLAGEYTISERIMLHCSAMRKNQEVDYCIAFNDVVINNGMYARAVHLDLQIDGQMINSYYGDGIIVATPTGSTGYSLSAGGPIVMPDMDLMLVVPVCPHTFFSRPIVASAKSVVEIICRNFADTTTLTADGQFRTNLQIGDLLRIRVGNRKVKMVRLGDYSPIQRLKSKFNRL